MSPFIHLHTHSDHSLIDGLAQVKSLVKQAAQFKMPAVALTDQHNLFGAVKFYRAALQAGVKPILGADLRLYHDKPESTQSLILLCCNNQGYKNLSYLLSQAYIKGQYAGMPMIQADWLIGKSEGLICISSSREGILTPFIVSNNEQRSVDDLTPWRSLFKDRLYIEITRTGRDGEEAYIHQAVQVAEQYQLPLVASNDVRFITQEQFEAHEAKVCISNGHLLDDPKREKQYSAEQYFRHQDEMTALFTDLPSAIENSYQIAKRCNVNLTLDQHFLPDFPVPKGMTIETFLTQKSYTGLAQRLVQRYPEKSERQHQETIYQQRLQVELDVINQMGFPGYFLIVADFIQWAKNNDVPVGPGRGSGAGSLVAYALAITDLDPLQYDLLFERFLNPERVSLPDFDVDFCMEGRDKVIEYVSQHYGRDHVSQIITYGTMAAKAVVRDVGRVLGYPYGLVDGLAKLVPFELKMTLTKALEQEPLLQARYEDEEEVKTLIDLALQLEGTIRNVGKHAGGVVIAPKVLTEYTPLYCEQNGGSLVSQYDKDDVESVGLVKFDFLGLRTLTIIDWAVKNIATIVPKAQHEKIDINQLPLDDKASYALLKRCETTAVFQLESRGMKELVKRLQPDTFEDIIALVALFRPGPLQSGMVDDFVNRKHGRAKVDYPHPDLEPILKPTYGVIVYQEQVMQIAQVLAGYSLGSADMLRRAMGKKKAEEMAKQRQFFLAGAKKRGIEQKVAEPIFDLMEKFAEYGFNKSHSAAYALVAYQTAWLKAHYPGAFMAAVLSADMDNTDKVVSLIDECRDMGLKVLPPDVNSSAIRFTVADTETIHYGMGAIKGVGETALAGIIESRDVQGRFEDIYAFCQRITTKVNRRVIETLIKAGALDSFGTHRAALFADLSAAMQMAEQQRRDSDSGQNDLFGLAVPSQQVTKKAKSIVEPWSKKALLAAEKETLGLYLSGHPIEQYQDELTRFIPKPISAIEVPPSKGYQKKEVPILVAGLVIAMRVMKNKKGGKMAFITLDDQTSRIEVRIFTEVYQHYQAYLVVDALLIIKGTVAQDNYSGGVSVTAEELYDMTMIRQTIGKVLRICVDNRADNHQIWLPTLQQCLTASVNTSPGIPVEIDYQNKTARSIIQLGQDWRSVPSEQLLEQLQQCPDVTDAYIVYE